MRLDLPRGLIAIDQGHGHIHDDHIRLQPAGQIHRLAAVGRFADDLDRVLLAQQRDQALSHDLMIIGQQHSQSAAVSSAAGRLPARPLELASTSESAGNLAIRHYDEERAALAFGAPDLHASAEQFDALADAQQSETGRFPELLRVKAATTIGDGQADASAEPPHPDSGLLDPGVLDHVEQQLLGRPVQEGFECIRL